MFYDEIRIYNNYFNEDYNIKLNNNECFPEPNPDHKCKLYQNGVCNNCQPSYYLDQKNECICHRIRDSSKLKILYNFEEK